MRFTVDGQSLLEDTIAAHMATIREAALRAAGAENITALVLGGGYGRGEGGVYVVNGEERVYNDYDFFVVVPYSSRSRRKRLTQNLNSVKAETERVCGIHVDFSPPMPLRDLGRLDYEIMYMEAKAGHQVIYGPADVFNAIPEFDRGRPPLEEGARLFMNRGIGLCLARTKLKQADALSQDDVEFIVRNIYKALMAMGDSVLFLRGAYDPSYIGRRENFRALDLADVPQAERLREVYESSLQFKLRPQHDVPKGMTLESWLEDTRALYLDIFLWFERQRLQRPDLSWAAYEQLPSRLPLGSRTEMAKNVVRNVRAGRPSPHELVLHPRDRILKRLPQMLQGASSEAAVAMKLWMNCG